MQREPRLVLAPPTLVIVIAPEIEVAMEDSSLH